VEGVDIADEGWHLAGAAAYAGGMERALQLTFCAAIPVGHRVEVAGEGRLTMLTDLDTGIRYLVGGEASEPAWQGVVRACTVSADAEGTRTSLLVDAEEGAGQAEGAVRPAAVEATQALGGAASAYARAQAEARRWSSAPGIVAPPRP